MSLLDLPVRRPVAVSMVFLGTVLLGLVALQRIPVELFPAMQGDSLYVEFRRFGAEPEVIERDILLPLQARVSALPMVEETGGEVRGSSGQYWVRFEPGGDIKVRELELRRIAAAIVRRQPRNSTWMNVSSTESQTAAGGAFVMMIHVLGDADRSALFELADQLLVPRLAAVPGVSQAFATGAPRRQVTVTAHPQRVVAAGVDPLQLLQAVSRRVQKLDYAGASESEDGRTNVLVDGRPRGILALADAQVAAGSAAKVGHVADVQFGVAPQQTVLRVNGEPAVGVVVFQEQGANLLRLGAELRERVEELRAEVSSLGIDLAIGNDAAEEVEEQIGHLARQGFTGYLIALAVLFLFLREWRAVALVGLAVPVSLLTALALLYVFGQTLNLISLVGLSLSVGLLIDNSIVVYEAVLRRLERGLAATTAVRIGLRRTARAIAAASLTTAVVFLPMAFVDLGAFASSLVQILAFAILLPLTASLLVAVGLVPVLAYRLAAPAALRRVDEQRRKREESGGLRAPDPLRILFSGALASALRRPSAMLAGTIFAVVFTAITALPLLLASGGAPDAAEADSVQLLARFEEERNTVAVLAAAVGRVEEAVLAVDGVKRVTSNIEEDGASIDVELHEADERPANVDVALIRRVARNAAKQIQGLDLRRPEEDQQQGKGGREEVAQAFSGAPQRILLSGAQSGPLERLARDTVARLEAVPSVGRAWHWAPSGLEEIWVEPNRSAFEAFGLTLDEVLPMLRFAGREGYPVESDFLLPSGREVPVVVERAGAREANALRDLRSMRVQTNSGVAPIAALASIRQMPSPPAIVHRNGRREAAVYYRLEDDVPQSGAGREAVDREIAAVVQSVPRPSGYTVEIEEDDEQASLLRRFSVPAILLVLLVLAMVFESLSLPVLVILALPLTLLGASWVMLLTGTPAGIMSGAGIVMLFGLTVNPAILLVDRMQQRIRGGWSTGAAALASVRERTRPVLMTSATTIAALWPLALTTGRENEIWPPFAVVVMGGLATSTLLTLLVIPVAFILLRRLDDLFGRVGPWLVVGWLAATAAVVSSLTLTETVTSLTWQIVTSLLVGAGLLAVVVLLFRRSEMAVPDASAGPPALEVRNLKKIYGVPGPMRRAIRAPMEFAARVAQAGGLVAGVGDFQGKDLLRRFGPGAMLAAAPFFIAAQMESGGWQLVLWMTGAAFGARLLADVRRARGRADAAGKVEPGGVEGALRVLLPWLVLAAFAFWAVIAPDLASQPRRAALAWPLIAAALLAAAQLLRFSAVRQQRGTLPARAVSGPLRYPRTLLRRFALRVAGFDLPGRSVLALTHVNFRVEQGMVGILGPNGAGKTTLLRQLAGILEPTRGVVSLGGVPLANVQRVLAHWVGYLPQDAGMPGGFSAREYLMYFAALYNLPSEERKPRVESLLREVGLEGRAEDPIKSLSGGMRQRVAVARTLLRLPPVVIVDEPTVGLDPRERIRFRNLLARLARERIVLFSTHVVEDVAVACDRVLVMASGRLVFDGKPEALADVAEGKVWELRQPTEQPFVAAEGAILAEEAPLADGVVRRIVAARPPSVDATPVPARLEDGYLWLISAPRSAPAPASA